MVKSLCLVRIKNTEYRIITNYIILIKPFATRV